MPPTPIIDLQQLTRRMTAGQAPAAQAPATPAEPAPTYAARITRDIPARIEAARARLSAGDTRGGKAILDGVNAWIDEHADSLQEFSNYRGSDRFGRSVSKSALDLLERKSITELLPMTDPSANPRSVEFDAASRGWGPKTAELTRKARYENDPEAIALLSAATRPAAVSPVQPGKVSAAGPDEAFLSYYGTAKSRLAGGLPSDVAAQFSADEMVDMLGKSYRASDRVAGTALVGNVVAAVNEARDLEPAAKANLARSMFTAQGAAMESWGGEDDAKWRADGASVLSDLRRALPGEAFTAQKDTVARVMKTTAETAKLWAADGRPMPADKMAQFARIRLYNETRPAEPMRAEDQAAAAVITETSALQQRLTVSPVMSVPQGGKEGPRPEDLQAGYTYLRGLLRSAVGSAGADAFTAGRTLQEALPARKNEIALGLRQFSPTLTESEAANVAGLMVPMLLSGKEIDLRKLSDLTGKDPVVAATERADRLKGLENGTPEVVESATQRANKRLESGGGSHADLELNSVIMDAKNTSGLPFTSGAKLTHRVGAVMESAVVATQDKAYETLAGLPASALRDEAEFKAKAKDAFVSALTNHGLRAFSGAIPSGYVEQASELFAVSAFRALNPGGAGLAERASAAISNPLSDPLPAAGDTRGRTIGELLGAPADLAKIHRDAQKARGSFSPTLETASRIAAGSGLSPEVPASAMVALGPVGIAIAPVTALARGVTAMGPDEARILATGILSSPEGEKLSLPLLRARVIDAAARAAPPTAVAEPAAPAVPEAGRVDPLLLAGVDVAVARSGLDKIKARADKPVSDAATADLLTRSVPNTLEMMVRRGELSPVDARWFEAAVHEKGEAGTGFKDIAEWFNKNVELTSTEYAKRQAKAKFEQQKALFEMRQAAGMGGLADPDATE